MYWDVVSGHPWKVVAQVCAGSRLNYLAGTWKEKKQVILAEYVAYVGQKSLNERRCHTDELLDRLRATL